MPPASLEDRQDPEDFLRRTHQNLLILQEREAKYASNAPLDLLNQIDDHKVAIALTEQVIEGKISREDWQEFLKPLNLSLARTTNIFQVIQAAPPPVMIVIGVAILIIVGLGIANVEPVRLALFHITPTLTPPAVQETPVEQPDATPAETPIPTSTSTPTVTNTPFRLPTSDPTRLPSPTATPVVSPTPPDGSPTPLVLEKTENTEISEKDILGDIRVEYPVRMSPGAGDVVNAWILIPEHLVSLVPIELTRVPIPTEIPPGVGELNLHEATILVREVMRVELSSSTFDVGDAYPSSIQSLDIYSFNEPIFWIWDIVAPDAIGLHYLTVSVFRGTEDIPTWRGNFQVEVIELTPIPLPTTAVPTPTLTPIPTPPALTRIGDALIDNPAIVIGSITTIIVALIGLMGTIYVRRSDKSTNKPKQKRFWRR